MVGSRDCPACGRDTPEPDGGYYQCPNRECDVIAFASKTTD